LFGLSFVVLQYEMRTVVYNNLRVPFASCTLLFPSCTPIG